MARRDRRRALICFIGRPARRPDATGDEALVRGVMAEQLPRRITDVAIADTHPQNSWRDGTGHLGRGDEGIAR